MDDERAFHGNEVESGVGGVVGKMLDQMRSNSELKRYNWKLFLTGSMARGKGLEIISVDQLGEKFVEDASQYVGREVGDLFEAVNLWYRAKGVGKDSLWGSGEPPADPDRRRAIEAGRKKANDFVARYSSQMPSDVDVVIQIEHGWVIEGAYWSDEVKTWEKEMEEIRRRIFEEENVLVDLHNYKDRFDDELVKLGESE